VPGLCDTEVPGLRLVAGDAHMAACHYSEELVDVTVESLRASVDATAEAELLDTTLLMPGVLGQEEVEVEASDVFVEEGVAHPGVTERSLDDEGAETWPDPAGRDAEPPPEAR
jgi:hypothetical protein